MHLVVRADGSPAIGVGHLMRTYALAEVWLARGGRVTLAGAVPAPVAARFAAAGADVVPIPWADQPVPGEVTERWPSPGGSWCVIDGYRFDATYTGALRAAGWRVAVVDDLADRAPYDADVLINQNLGAERFRYDASPRSLQALGAGYAMLRREFTARPWARRDHPPLASPMLVTMGGGDPDRVAARVVRVLADPRLAGISARVLVGPANPDGRAAVAAAAAQVPGRVEIIESADVPAEMARASMAITAAGSTVWEGAFAGLPMLLVVTADNQRGVAHEADAAGAARLVGAAGAIDDESLVLAISSLACDAETRRVLSERAMALVDGAGAERVVDVLLGHRLLAGGYEVSPVTDRDTEALWLLANEPAVRAAAFSSAPIPWATHVAWLRGRLSGEGASGCRIYAVRPADARVEALVAQVRYDRVDDQVAEIDVAVAPSRRGEGLGSAALCATFERGCRALGVGAARGLVLEGNAASAAAFRRSGFALSGRGMRDGRPFEIYERRVSGRKRE